MGLLCKLILCAGTIIVAWVGFGVYQMLQPSPMPQLPQDQWWGPGQPKKTDTSIKPFKINVSDKILETLKARLETTTFTPPLEGIQFEYGFNTNTLKKVVDFWKNKYNWREREVFLNQYPQFKTNVQGLDLHYIHVKPKVAKDTKVLPLLMLHGWPGSIREFYGIIPLLTTKQPEYDFVFELIIPSLPGYGFSDAASKPGLGAAQMAIVMKNLMVQLGIKQFYVQGGDWGSMIVKSMATFYPEIVLGHHSNMCAIQTPLANLKLIIGSFFPTWFAGEHASKMYPIGHHFQEILLESGYAHLHATKPDTVGVALRDSPVGLAAYILEKFSTWTEKKWRSIEDGGLPLKYKYEDLLDNVMIYYVTGSITTSMRLYSEVLNKAQSALNMDSVPTTVPTACADFPNELGYQTDSQLEEKFHNLLQRTNMPRGGHFAAFEEPRLLADDVFAATAKFIKFNQKKNTSQKIPKTEM